MSVCSCNQKAPASTEKNSIEKECISLCKDFYNLKIDKPEHFNTNDSLSVSNLLSKAYSAKCDCYNEILRARDNINSTLNQKNKEIIETYILVEASTIGGADYDHYTLQNQKKWIRYCNGQYLSIGSQNKLFNLKTTFITVNKNTMAVSLYLRNKLIFTYKYVKKSRIPETIKPAINRYFNDFELNYSASQSDDLKDYFSIEFVEKRIEIARNYENAGDQMMNYEVMTFEIEKSEKK